MAATTISRRQMLKTTAGGTAAAAILSVGSATLAAQTSSNKPLRIGIIGLGNRSRAHIPIIKDRPERCQITAICDIVPAKIEAGVKHVGPEVKTFANHKELITSGLCDAVLVTTPNYAHKEIVLDALAGGLHVLCEKPMATNLADAKAIVDAVAKSDRVFAVGLQFRHAAIYRKLKELITSGVIGDLKYVWAENLRSDWALLYKDPVENARKNWRYFDKLSGGTLLEKNCHDFDILGWLIGTEPVKVTASGGNSVYRDRETIDHATVVTEFANGASLALGLCLFATTSEHNTKLIGTEGTITFPRGGTTITILQPKKQPREIDVSKADPDKFGHHGTHLLHKDFLDAIAEGRPPVTNVKVGYEAMKIALAGEESIRKGRTVEMAKLKG